MMEDNDDLLGGIVAVDETYLGGKQRKKGQTSKRELDDAQPKGRSGTRKSARFTEISLAPRWMSKAGTPRSLATAFNSSAVSGSCGRAWASLVRSTPAPCQKPL
jgi:hypothetical protein